MRVSLLDTPIDVLTLVETVDLAKLAMKKRLRLQHVAMNVAKLVNMRTDATLSEDVRGSDIVGIDGMGILFALKLFGIDVKERVAGIDLFENLLVVCEQEGFRPYFLGATQQVLDEAVRVIKEKHPRLQLAGCQHGHFPAEQEASVIQEIRRAGADCLFIGMPTPRKERLLARYRDTLGVPFIMGVGGTFDVVSGLVARAPMMWQSLGLEWLYRVVQEPRRLWWRYFRTNSIFVYLLASEIVKRNALISHPKPS